MDKSLSHYIRVQAIASIIINGVLNGLIIFFLSWGKDVSATGQAVILITLAIDNVITCPLLGYFGATSAISNLKKAKTLAILPPASLKAAQTAQHMQKPGRYGFLLGLIATPVVFALTSAAVLAFDVETLAKWGYVFYKAAYTALVSGAFCIFFLYNGMHKPGQVFYDTKPHSKPS